jgi:hypothetical protein
MANPTATAAVASGTADFDRRDLDWYIDRAVQVIVFICGISAIIFVLGIFLFVTKEGIGFIFERMDFREFFLTPYWFPSDPDEPEYGILALIAGTASVTGLAMLVAIPFSLGGGDLHRRVRHRQDPRGPQGPGRTAGRHSLGSVGLHRPGDHEPPDHRAIRCPRGPERA